MDISHSLFDFFTRQKTRYAELFWYEQRGNTIVVMVEKLAEQSRGILQKENQNDMTVTSFEADDGIGEFYTVGVSVIDVETRPSREEYESIMDTDLKSDFTDQTNDLYQNQLVRVYRPQGYTSWCVVAYHSFGMQVPRGPIGWIRNLDGLRGLDAMEFVKLTQLISFEDACKKYDGVKYQMGGGSFEHGFDCSALAQRIVYETQGVWLPRKARWQALVCKPLLQNELRQGDMVFFNRVDNLKNEIDHVALVYEPGHNTLPVVFHAKRIHGRSLFEDLNKAEWLASAGCPAGDWEINSFGRIQPL